MAVMIYIRFEKGYLGAKPDGVAGTYIRQASMLSTGS